MPFRRGLTAIVAAILFSTALFLINEAMAVAPGAANAAAPTPAPILPHETPPPAASVTPTPAITPTLDRLAPPPTAESPTQADEGAYAYWLNCQPCHGDRGQGLTEDWIAQYPPEDQNCWESGCHGNSPYENGFTLPTRVPPLTGSQSLQRFQHMGQVLAYMSAAMPYNAPGSLEEDDYLAIAAFLAREHGVWDGQPLRPESALALRLRPAERPTATVVAPPDAAPQEDETAAVQASTTPAIASQTSGAGASTQAWTLAIILSVVAVIFVVLVGGWWRRGRRPH